MMFAPVLAHVSNAVIGPAEDNLVFAWNLWWGKQALAHGESLTYTHSILFPQGHSLLLHSMSWFNVGVGAVLQTFMSLPLTYNVLLLSTFVIGALGAYLLARDRIGSRKAALLAGFVFAFNPLHFGQGLHHLNIASIQFLPWLVRSHLSAAERGGWTPPLKTALWLALASLCEWYFLVYGLLFFGFDTIIRALENRRLHRGALRASFIACGGAFLLLCPLLVPMTTLALKYSPSSDGAPDPTNFNAADLFSFVWTNPYHPLWGAAESFIHKPFTGHTWEIAVPLGLANLFLLAVCLRSKDRHASRYEFLMLVGFAVLALGTRLHVLGASVTPPILPYALLREIPLLNFARVPARAMTLGYLFLALLAARGLKTLLEGRGEYSRWIAMALTVVVLVEFWSSTEQACPHRTPAVYAQLPTGGEQYGILEMPSGSHVSERAYMYYQTLHGIPIAGGFVARPQHYGVFDEIENVPVNQMGPVLRANHIRFLVIDKRSTDPRLSAELTRLFPSRYSDATHDLLEVTAAP
jgi:hypothetical protein